MEALPNRRGEADLRAQHTLREVRRHPAVIRASADRGARKDSAATSSLGRRNESETIGVRARSCFKDP